MQLFPARVAEQIPNVRRVRARRNEEDVVDLVGRFGERHAVLERVHDALGRREPDDFVELRLLEPEIHQGHPPLALPGGRARHVPRRGRSPLQVARGRHEGDECLRIDERGDQVVEAGSRERSGRHGAGW